LFFYYFVRLRVTWPEATQCDGQNATHEVLISVCRTKTENKAGHQTGKGPR